MFRRLRKDQDGTTAVEFAMVLPGVMFLMFGAFHICVMMYAANCLQATTEAAARYASIQTSLNSGTPPTNATVSTYALSKYAGPGLKSLSFNCNGGVCISTPGCAHPMTGSGTYMLYYGWGKASINLSTTACFP